MKIKTPALRCALHVGPVSAFALLLAACSGSSVPDVDRVFLSAAGNWDRNRDGIVTCDEWKAYAGELFDAADTNRDGALDSAEYAKVISIDRMFETADFSYYDSNKDGKVDRMEFVERPNRAFALLDKNNECRLSANQVAGARAHSEQIFDNKKAESGDPREKKTPGLPN
ncbi:EF-hand domain-containing protein [Hyphomicrobium sp. NDB2Meth4]|uniref:EF-hand domain-containing protein n=1 Tax=Hyphomicrobium sp. NDB2Meth4 TaxID=1892846 RepID=UPI0009FA49EA|nr:EF-hand domain-containing protein [Hyphomicrobium sp. NDB2Meth4]